MNFRRTMVSSLVIALSIFGTARAEAPASAQVNTDSLLGHWVGVRQRKGTTFTIDEGVDIEIRRAVKGGLELIDHARETVGLTPVEVTLLDARHIAASWPSLPGRTSLTGELSHDRRTLQVSLRRDMFGAGEPASVSLHHGDASARRFFAPRLAADGSRLTAYQYNVPAAFPDGIPTGAAAEAGVDTAKLSEMVREILGQQDGDNTNQTDSVLIARHGKLVFEEYFWGYDQEALHEISSDTKSITSILAGIAADKGLLDVDKPIIGYFKSYTNTRWMRETYPVTLADTLSMQANLDWNEELPYQDPNNTAMGLIEADDSTRFVLDRPLAGPPGAKFQYNSGLPLIAGEVVSEAAEQSLDSFAQRSLFGPLGIKSYDWSREKNGHVLPAGGLFLRPRDMLKIGQMMLDKGLWLGQQVVSREWVERSTTRRTRGDDYPYGYYWHLSGPQGPTWRGPNAFMAIGQAGQYIIVCPESETVVVVTSANWQPGGTRLAMSALINKFIAPSILQ